MQEALLAAAVQWPAEGVPEQPAAWLITVGVAPPDRPAAQRARPAGAARTRPRPWCPPTRPSRRPPTTSSRAEDDDTLTLLFLCCHPALSPPSQLALTLRAVGGLTTAEIARAFLVPEATMAQRISRAKQRIKASRHPVRHAARGRARRTAARRPARPLPDLQRGLHRHLGPRPAAHRADRRGDPADPRRAPAAARRRRGRRAARADAAHRRAPPGPHRRRRGAGRRSPSRTAACWDRRRPSTRASRSSPTRWRAPPLGPVPAAGGDRRGPRRGAARAGHRLAADPRPVRAARARSRPTRWSP